MRKMTSRPAAARKLMALAAAATALFVGLVAVGAPSGAAPKPSKTAQSISFTSTVPSPVVVGMTYRPAAVATSGLAVTFTLGKSSRGCSLSGGLVTFNAPGTCVINADQAGNQVYSAAPRVSQSVTVPTVKTAQTVAFTSTPPSPALLGGTYRPTATASSGLSVKITRDGSSTGCTFKSGRVTFTAYGTCVLNADQAGNTTYAAAPRVQQTITISKRTQAVSFTSAAPSPALVGSTYTPTATATSGLPVALSLGAGSAGCTLSGGLVSFTAPGTCVINADQAGNGTYAAAPRVQQSIEVSKRAQTVSFTSTAPTSPTVGDTYTPAATATSGLAVAITLDEVSSGCVLDSGVITLTAAGTCVVNADQPGNGTYAAAPRAQQSFAVGKRTQSVSFTSTAPTSANVGDTYTPTASANSGLTAALSLDEASTGCTLTDGDVSFTAFGTCVINADQAGNGTYAAAPRVQQSIEISKRAQTVSFTSTAPTSPVVGDTYTPVATATSGLSVVLSLDETRSSCTLDGGVVTFTAAGTCIVNADQAGNGAYDSAPSAQQSIDVVAAPVPATAVDDAASVDRYSTANAISVLGNDSNPSGVPVAVTAVTQPTHGTVIIAADGQSVDYVPAGAYCNTDALGTIAADTFTYTLNGTSVATVSVKVVTPNDAPVVTEITSKRGSAAPVPIVDYFDPASNIMRNTLSILIDAPVTDPGACRPDSLTVSWVLTYDGAAGPYRVQGITGYNSPTLNIAANSLVLAPNPPGVTFTYIVTSNVTGAEARVDFLALVTQTSASQDLYEQCQATPAQCLLDVLLPEGLPATAVDDTATVPRNSTGTTITVRANDTSQYGDPRITAVTQPAHGYVTISPGAGSVSYVPATDYCTSDAPDTFTYTLNYNSTATASVTVPCE